MTDSFRELAAGLDGNAAQDPRELPSPSAPMEVAREFVDALYRQDGLLTLRHWRGGWWRWRTSCWVELEERAMAAAAYRFTEHAVYRSPKGLTVPWAPNRHKIADLLDALAAVVHLPEGLPMPGWLDGTIYDGLLVSVANGLFDVGRRELLEHTPLFWNATSVPFAYDPGAPPPGRWTTFLNELWPDDGDSTAALQEWFGYTISGRLDLHKILLLVGPTRAGKGVTARILSALVGTENVAGPTLSSLKGDFGLAPLLGKTLAVVSDARLNGRGAHTVVERLLSISGEDTLTVNRKYRDQWTGKLPTRIMLCSNELPQLGDASMAIAGRFVPLMLTNSWLGREDHELEQALREELPGILNWSLDGLERIAASGRFTRPPGAEEAMIALQDLASPVAAFVRDRCVRGSEREVAIDVLYAAWKAWADDNGHVKSTKQVFGRDLRAAVPGLRVARVGGHESVERERVYQGVALRNDRDEPREHPQGVHPLRANADAVDAKPSVAGIADADLAHPSRASTASAITRSVEVAAADAAAAAVAPENDVPHETSRRSVGDWECPCGEGHPGQPGRTLVSLREPYCPFCGGKYRDEYRRSL